MHKNYNFRVAGTTVLLIAALLLPFDAASVVPADVAGFTATAVDASGNTFVAGYFDGNSIAIGSETLTRIGTNDAFVAKIDASGRVAWARNFGGPYVLAASRGIAVDSVGNAYLSGSFDSGNLTTPSLARIGANDAFVLKLDSNGNTVWAHNFGGNGAFTGSGSVAVDDFGNVYLGGTFQNANLTAPALAKIGYTDVFAIKLDAAGNTVWAKNFGGSGPPWADVEGGLVAVDGSDSVYVSGYFSGADLTFPSLTRLGTYDTFVIKLDSRGTLAWAKSFGGGGAWMKGQAVAVDSVSHDVFLSGYFSNGDLSYPTLAKLGSQDAFALRLDSTGAIVWSRDFGGSGAKTWGLAVATDNIGDAYVAGFIENASLTTPALPRIGTTDAFAIKLDLAGSVAWAHDYGGGNSLAQGTAVAVDNAGKVHLSGEFARGDMVVPPLALIGANDAFAITLNSDGNIADARNFWSLGSPVPPPPITPQVGLWWNPAESGSGYAIDFRHDGVAVVTIYSYNSDGTPQWYLMTGTLTANNTVSGPLTKFDGGQCITCAYKAPTANGNDGTMSILFTSAKTAMVIFEGGRSINIVTPSF